MPWGDGKIVGTCTDLEKPYLRLTSVSMAIKHLLCATPYADCDSFNRPTGKINNFSINHRHILKLFAAKKWDLCYTLDAPHSPFYMKIFEETLQLHFPYILNWNSSKMIMVEKHKKSQMFFLHRRPIHQQCVQYQC